VAPKIAFSTGPRACIGYFIGGGEKTEGPKAENGVGFLGRGSNPYQLGGLGAL